MVHCVIPATCGVGGGTGRGAARDFGVAWALANFAGGSCGTASSSLGRGAELLIPMFASSSGRSLSWLSWLTGMGGANGWVVSSSSSSSTTSAHGTVEALPHEDSTGCFGGKLGSFLDVVNCCVLGFRKAGCLTVKWKTSYPTMNINRVLEGWVVARSFHVAVRLLVQRLPSMTVTSQLAFAKASCRSSASQSSGAPSAT
eukprot:980186-Amphidinium_carterae.2